MRNLVREDLVENLIHTAELPRAEAMSVVETILSSISSALGNGENVSVRRFGTFGVRHRRARIARNPKTNAPVEVPAKKIIFFKSSAELKEVLNAGISGTPNGGPKDPVDGGAN